MNRQNAEKTIAEYLKPVFGFALKRCRSVQDAEDLSQEIILLAFRALLNRDDIAEPGKFIWTVAHNALSNYYRDNARSVVGASIDDIAEVLADSESFAEDDSAENVRRLQRGIAYLSGLQRRIVIAYYFEHRRQADIAQELGIPLGTVKWHLFEAKKELKRGMNTMRQASQLKFNPIRFDSYGLNGTVGTKSPDEFFRSALSQNICYCVRNEAKTVEEIADDLGVSPVFVEAEVDFLEEYGFLHEQKGRYIVNFLIGEPTAGLLTLKDAMYKRAAGLFANELYDELTESGLIDDKSIICNRTLPGSTLSGSTCEGPLRDKNFLLWALVPYIAACSGKVEQTISFEEAATIRPDGGHNICQADVIDRKMVLPPDYVYMKNFCGPMWKGNGRNALWQINSEWSERDAELMSYSKNAVRILSLYEQEKEHPLAREDYAWLSELGYVRTDGDYDGNFTSSWQTVILADRDIRRRLLAVGSRIKEKHRAEFDEIKAPYVRASLDSVPEHLRKMKQYDLQFTFHSDGWFLLHCLVALLNNGRLTPPAKEQRRALSTLIVPE